MGRVREKTGWTGFKQETECLKKEIQELHRFNEYKALKSCDKGFNK